MVISKTPLRISFGGGGTDLPAFYKFEDGKVLSCTIDKYIYVIIKERFDNKIVLNYTKREVVDDVNDIQHELVREALIETGISNGVEIWTPADIPSKGSGLGSSSSLTVGLLNAFSIFNGKQLAANDLAKNSCDIEINKLEKPIGKQDQYSAAYGGLNEITFCKDNSVLVEPIKISKKNKLVFGSNILLYYTNINRLSSTILNEQKANTQKNIDVLQKMKDQVDSIRNVLEKKTEFHEVGHVLHKSWQLKKKLANTISNKQIDKMYSIGHNAGAIGGKICGAGGGGFLMLYIPRENQNNVRNAMKAYKELPFMLEPYGTRIIFNSNRNYW